MLGDERALSMSDLRVERGKATRERLVATGPRAVRARRLRGHLGRGRASTRPGSRRARSITTSRTSPLFDAVLDQVVSDVAGKAARAAARHDDPVESLRAGCAEWLRIASTPRFSRSPSSMPPPCSLGALARARRAVHAGVRRSLQGLADSGRVPAAQVDALANMLLAAVGEAALLIVQADDPGARSPASRRSTRCSTGSPGPLDRAPPGWLDRPLRKLAPILVAAALLAGCTIPRPPGDAPLRYRDVVFGGSPRPPTSSTAPRRTCRATRST